MATTKDLFSAIAANIQLDPTLVDKIKGVFQFNIGDEKWAVDLKTAPGGVKEGPAEKPDVTLTMASADFLALASGKLNGQQAFMQGKLKIAGNMSFAMKLGMLFQSKTSQGGASPAAASGGDPIHTVFDEIEKNVKADATLVKKINGVYQFNITSGGQTKNWTVDLKNEPGRVHQGAAEKADVTISFGKEEDFLAIVTGRLDGQQAFMQGKMKMTGNMALAMKLGQVLGSKKATARL